MGIIMSPPEIYVPEDIITNADLSTLVDTSDEWIIPRTGMKEGRISYELGVQEMGAIVGEKLLKANTIYEDDIDEVIFATNLHDEGREFPCHAGYVAGVNGIESAIISDTGAGCSGFVYALRQGYNNLVADPSLRRVMVIGGERLTDMTDYSDRATCVLFGDAVGGCILERSESEEGIVKIVAGGKPDMNNFLGLEDKVGVKLTGRWKNGNFKTKRVKQNYLVMNGNEVFKFAVRAMTDAVHAVLEGTKYTLDNVDLIFPHGANKRIIDGSIGRLDIPPEKVYTNLDVRRNTSTGSVPLAMRDAMEKRILKRDQLIIVGPVFGAGFTWAGALVRMSSTGLPTGVSLDEILKNTGS